MVGFESYIICTSPRSGSTLLCRMLQEVGSAGMPDSHFHDPELEKWFEYYGLSSDAFENPQEALRAIFHAAQLAGRGNADVFGLRLQRGSFDFLMTQLKVLYPACEDDKTRFERAFGKTLFVHLYRPNKLDQAISVVKAMQSGLWHKAPEGTELERSCKGQEPVYDRAAISEELAAFVKADADWNSWFATEGIRPLLINYEALSTDPHTQLSRVLNALGLEYLPDKSVALPVAKLSDDVSCAWAERYRSEVPGLMY